MYKKLILFALACGMLAGCSKETPCEAGSESYEGLCKAEIQCRIEPQSYYETKSAADTDDKVYKLDVLVYDSSTKALVDHYVYSDANGIDLDTFILTEYHPVNTSRYYFFLANLHADSITYLKQFSFDNISGSYGTYSTIPLSAGNWSAGHIPMGGIKYITYYNGMSRQSVDMVRYLFRLDIQKITADFDDDAMMAKAVKVKKVAIINAVEFFKVHNGYTDTEFMGSYRDLTSDLPFGNVTEGYKNINQFGTVDEESEYDFASHGGTGLLYDSFNYYVNFNYQKGERVLNLTAPSSIQSMIQHTAASGMGVLCPSATPVYNCNLTLYAPPKYEGSSISYNTVFGDYYGQNRMMKLVLEVEIDGVNCYYPILLRAMQPNTRYIIKNITLRGKGSVYSNFFPRIYEGGIDGVSVLEWTDTTIDNINVGYTDDQGTAIY